MFGFLPQSALRSVSPHCSLSLRQANGLRIAAPAADLPNGAMVQRFDSYLYKTRRALPAPAQVQIDALAAALPALRETMERVPTLDPVAQDARRLMPSICLA